MDTPKIIKETIVGKSPTGNPMVSFDNEMSARRWIETRPDHRINFFKQITTEEEIKL